MNTQTEHQATVKISPRLRLIASFVPEGAKIADIGTDHGYVPVYLAQTGRIQSALAMDIGKGPLLRAKEHIEAWKPEGVPIETRLSDGLKELKPGEADTVIIAGMGGELEIRILEEGRHVRDSIRTWVLSPQSDLEKVRRYLEQEGFRISEEAMICDEGKYYTVMKAEMGEMRCKTVSDYRYGPCLIQKKDPVLKEYLQKERRRVEGILKQFEQAGAQKTEGMEQAEKSLKEELTIIEEAEHEMQ